MQNIIIGNKLSPKCFVEYFPYSIDRPFTIIIKEFKADDIVIPHYADTTEILLCCDLVGEMNIGNQKFFFSGKQIFFIPPNYVHSNVIKKCDGKMYVLKISSEHIQHYLNLPRMLDFISNSSEIVPFVCNEYAAVKEVIDTLIAGSDDLFSQLIGILQIYKCLHPYFETANTPARKIDITNRDIMRDLVTFTENQWDRIITIDEAARTVGYSKYYFCKWFKEKTGMTYHEYLSRVKISYACKLLQQGQTVMAVSHTCGYANTSYFIRLFRQYMHCTPKEYAQNSDP